MSLLTRPFPAKLALGLPLLCVSLLVPASSHAQPVTNRVLSGYQIASGGGCSIYKINFNFRIRYDSHFPVTTGNQLRILFRPIDPREFVIQGGFEREALRPPQDRHTAIKAIEYEARIAESPSLTIVFDRNVHFSAAGGTDFQSLVVSVGDPKNGRPCKPVYPSVAGDSTWGDTAATATPQARPESAMTRRAPAPAPIPDVPETKNAAVIGPSEVTAVQTGSRPPLRLRLWLRQAPAAAQARPRRQPPCS